ncbi:MAG: hypothetical protein R2748_00990 [Bryobacterales bacterium]
MAVLYMAWTDSPDRLTYVIAIVIGFSHLTGGAYMLWKEPASEVKLDIPSGRLEIRRWGLFGKQRQGLPLASIEKAEIEVGEHAEGGEIYRPALLLRSGERLPSSMFWYQTETRCTEIVDRVNEFLISRRHLIPQCHQD